ncbi:12903_t:CDS:2, partial [Acaulospora colombiana]
MDDYFPMPAKLRNNDPADIMFRRLGRLQIQFDHLAKDITSMQPKSASVSTKMGCKNKPVTGSLKERNSVWEQEPKKRLFPILVHDIMRLIVDDVCPNIETGALLSASKGGSAALKSMRLFYRANSYFSDLVTPKLFSNVAIGKARLIDDIPS